MKKIIIFTDGSSLGNPGPGGFGVVIIYNFAKVIELGGKEKNTTNNRMELSAVISTLEYFVKYIPEKSNTLSIYCDSRYVINGVTEWIFLWQKNGWKTKNKTDVLNKDLWQKISKLLNKIANNIKWNYVPGHVGVPGNERADDIAQGFAKNEKINLYDGLLNKYSILNITQIPSVDNMPYKKKGKVYSYLSLVDGVIKRHKTWDMCKKRVSGKSNVRFKKTFSEIDEREIINNWRKEYN